VRVARLGSDSSTRAIVCHPQNFRLDSCTPQPSWFIRARTVDAVVLRDWLRNAGWVTWPACSRVFRNAMHLGRASVQSHINILKLFISISRQGVNSRCQPDLALESDYEPDTVWSCQSAGTHGESGKRKRHPNQGSETVSRCLVGREAIQALTGESARDAILHERGCAAERRSSSWRFVHALGRAS
jgi:hypothetical protein